MGKTLVITEKPSVAQDLAKTVDPTARRGNGCLEGSGYTFTWAMGRLGGLAGPEEYEPGLKGKWRLDLLPGILERPKLQAVSGKQEQLGTAKRLPRDAGREEEILREMLGGVGPRWPVGLTWRGGVAKLSGAGVAQW
ncbi:MAG: hypothetical protein M0Z27_09085 [Thermaerobacter sp.]|nr:hypothetical protein [Thermaerobacter sp.]